MFWLFRRKKVADKKCITPCVCDNGEDTDESLNLKEFPTGQGKVKIGCQPRSISEGALSKLTATDGRGNRKGYHRLEGDPLPEAEEVVATTSRSTTCDDIVLRHFREEEDSQQNSLFPDSNFPVILDYESSSTDYSDEYTGFNSDSYDDEDLTCTVCDRSFFSVRQLLQHQQKKRHYGCSICDSIFQNLMALELHKETLDHWSEDELRFRDTDSEDDDDSFYDNVYDAVPCPRELERLL